MSLTKDNWIIISRKLGQRSASTMHIQMMLDVYQSETSLNPTFHFLSFQTRLANVVESLLSICMNNVL